MKNVFLIFILSLILNSCAVNHKAILDKTLQIAAANNFKQKTHQTKNFRIFTLEKITDKSKPLRIYIEGDGKAYISKYKPSSNPTPQSFFLINLIIQDDYPNIIYVARPCQYLDDSKCQEKYWTNDRFSHETISSIAEVVNNFAPQKVELIGYSGGAVIAKYIAAKTSLKTNSQVINFRSIAGNLDEDKFVEIHQVTKLNHPALSIQEINNLRGIAQIHFVGNDDKIIPQEVAISYLEKLSNSNCVKIINVEKASHSKGWQQSWQSLSHLKPQCFTQ